MTTVQITLPDALAQEATNAGLLTPQVRHFPAKIVDFEVKAY